MNRPMNREVFITAAVTGAGDSLSKHPGVPVTPEQIADAAIASAKAGAAIVHCHVRDPDTGKGCRNLELYSEVYQRIRQADVDAVINFTAGMGGDVTFVEGEKPALDPCNTDLVGPMTRLAHIEELKPEICTLDCGSMNFSDDADFIVMNTPMLLRKMAKRIQELGVKAECEVFDSGHLWFVNKLVKEGLLTSPAMVQICMGIPWGAPADVTTAKAMVDNMPPGAIYSGFAISRDQMPFAALMPMLGGNVRVGLEDNLYLKRGVLATNEQLVSKAKDILENMGCRILGPEEVRKKLGLVKHPYKGFDYVGARAAKALVNQPVPLATTMATGIPRKVVVVGGGVIGAGWAARFLLNGADVTVLDPCAGAERKVKAVLENAREALSSLLGGTAKLPKAGSLSVVSSASSDEGKRALTAAEYVQESLPEVLEMKRRCYAEIENSGISETVVIASSTSGILPSDLQAGMRAPGRLVVAHPFNPVYLLPLVEVVGGSGTDEGSKKRAAEVYTAIGMHPLLLGAEVPGFVSDRLLEALWREGLHLVNEGVATTGQVDDAIAYGPGLRWSFMGSFLTYRLAGGEGGMRHFMQQFGPALKWPWTKLVAPELTETLIDDIVAGTDAQVAALPKDLSELRALERKRDRCLIAVLGGLREENFGAGRVVNEYAKRVGGHGPDFQNAKRAETANGSVAGSKGKDALFCKLRASVKKEWIDYNGHMTESRYLEVFGDATDAVLLHIGMGPDYVAREKKSYYTVETHIMNKKDIGVGEPLLVRTQVLKVDDKRLHLLHTMEHEKDGVELATAEQMLLHVDSSKGCACQNGSAPAIAALRALLEQHADVPRPSAVGRFVGAPRT